MHTFSEVFPSLGNIISLLSCTHRLRKVYNIFRDRHLGSLETFLLVEVIDWLVSRSALFYKRVKCINSGNYPVKLLQMLRSQLSLRHSRTIISCGVVDGTLSCFNVYWLGMVRITASTFSYTWNPTNGQIHRQTVWQADMETAHAKRYSNSPAALMSQFVSMIWLDELDYGMMYICISLALRSYFINFAGYYLYLVWWKEASFNLAAFRFSSVGASPGRKHLGFKKRPLSHCGKNGLHFTVICAKTPILIN